MTVAINLKMQSFKLDTVLVYYLWQWKRMVNTGKFRPLSTMFVSFMKHFCEHLKKIPYKSTLLPDLRVLHPEERTTLNDFPSAIVSLAQHFRQLELGGKLDILTAKALNFQASLPISTTGIDYYWYR